MGNICSPCRRWWCLWWRLFVLSCSPLDVLDEIWDLIESDSEGFLTYCFLFKSRLKMHNNASSICSQYRLFAGLENKCCNYQQNDFTFNTRVNQYVTSLCHFRWTETITIFKPYFNTCFIRGYKIARLSSYSLITY